MDPSFIIYWLYDFEEKGHLTSLHFGLFIFNVS